MYQALKDEIPELVVISLRDRDDEPLEGVGADLVDGVSSGDFHPRRWRRRYIESYLTWPPAIAKSIGKHLDEVTNALATVHGLSVPATFRDTSAPLGMMDVRGKIVLETPGISVSPYEVAKNMAGVDIPEDIVTFLNDLIALG